MLTPSFVPPISLLPLVHLPFLNDVFTTTWNCICCCYSLILVSTYKIKSMTLTLFCVMSFSSMHFLADSMILFSFVTKYCIICKYIFFILSPVGRHLYFFLILEEILKYILEGEVQKSLSSKHVSLTIVWKFPLQLLMFFFIFFVPFINTYNFYMYMNMHVY